MAIIDADPSLVIKFKSMENWPLPCQMVFVLKLLTQVQQTEVDSDEAYKHKSRLVICGNFAALEEHSTTTTNLDAPLLRLMLSLATAQETTWSSVDITSAFLNADLECTRRRYSSGHPTTDLGEDEHCEAKHCLACQEAIYRLREALRLWQGERDQQLRDLKFVYQDKKAHLVQSHIHPSLWLL